MVVVVIVEVGEVELGELPAAELDAGLVAATFVDDWVDEEEDFVSIFVEVVVSLIAEAPDVAVVVASSDLKVVPIKIPYVK